MKVPRNKENHFQPQDKPSNRAKRRATEIEQKKILFRVDSGLYIGAGHLMRCLTLAEALSKQGYECYFCSEPKEGHLNHLIIEKGFQTLWIAENTPEPAETNHAANIKPKDPYNPAHWLPVSQQQDAENFLKLSHELKNVVLYVVDHYSIDADWHHLVRKKTPLLVIDDCANRRYEADILLDQNLGRSKQDYSDLIPEYCQLLIGLNYALLRTEFIEMRRKLEKRSTLIRTKLNSLVIAMGGVDLPNSTLVLLKLLKKHETELPFKQIQVILGATNPHLKSIQQQAAKFQSVQVEMIQGTDRVSDYLAQADLAFGAAGSTSWERCVLGLPVIAVELAENQQLALHALVEQGVALQVSLDKLETEGFTLLEQLINSPDQLTKMSENAIQLVDGLGTQRVIQHIESILLAN